MILTFIINSGIEFNGFSMYVNIIDHDWSLLIIITHNTLWLIITDHNSVWLILIWRGLVFTDFEYLCPIFNSVSIDLIWFKVILMTWDGVLSKCLPGKIDLEFIIVMEVQKTFNRTMLIVIYWCSVSFLRFLVVFY